MMGGSGEGFREKFRAEGVKGIFIPHCNFGTGVMCVPGWLRRWGCRCFVGPRDERPDENGVRLQDSQCGLLFATGKVLEAVPECRLHI